MLQAEPARRIGLLAFNQRIAHALDPVPFGTASPALNVWAAAPACTDDERALRTLLLDERRNRVRVSLLDGGRISVLEFTHRNGGIERLSVSEGWPAKALVSLLDPFMAGDE